MLVSNYLSVKMLISHRIPLFLGVLPLPGSSTFDPKEELEEPCTYETPKNGR